MTQVQPPLRFDPAFETIADDEAATQVGLTEAMLAIQRKTLADTGYAHRAVHAKAHGYLKAGFEVLPDLPAHLAQGLFAIPASYDAILRFSTTPGDVLDDKVSTPRGLALKVLDVPGGRLPGSEGDMTQNYVLGNSPSFQVATASGFLQQLKLLAATTGHAEPAKEALSVLSRSANAALSKVGLKSATLTTLAGQATTDLLGDSFYSQGALLHGDYFAKVVVAPVSSELVALSDKPLDLAGHPDAIREAVQRDFAALPAVWELRVQLATDIDKMPVEDAATEWPEDVSPYVPVARITAAAQETWSDELRAEIEDRSAFNPWIGLAAHRPLGSIMRARRPAYAAARDFRARSNGVEINERHGGAGIAAAGAGTGPDQSSRPALPRAPARSTYPGGGAPSARPLSTLAALGTVGLLLGVSALVGRRNAPDPSHPGIRRWYRRLDKPGYTPPDAAFGAVWPVLETGLAVGGYRLLRRPSGTKRNTAIGLWLLNTAMVGGWTQLFFREKRLGASATASGAMVATGAAYVAAAAKVDRPAAAAAVPFVAWLGFATLLAERIWRDNPAHGR